MLSTASIYKHTPPLVLLLHTHWVLKWNCTLCWHHTIALMDPSRLSPAIHNQPYCFMVDASFSLFFSWLVAHVNSGHLVCDAGSHTCTNATLFAWMSTLGDWLKWSTLEAWLYFGLCKSPCDAGLSSPLCFLHPRPFKMSPSEVYCFNGAVKYPSLPQWSASATPCKCWL